MSFISFETKSTWIVCACSNVGNDSCGILLLKSVYSTIDERKAQMRVLPCIAQSVDQKNSIEVAYSEEDWIWVITTSTRECLRYTRLIYVMSQQSLFLINSSNFLWKRLSFQIEMLSTCVECLRSCVVFIVYQCVWEQIDILCHVCVCSF